MDALKKAERSKQGPNSVFGPPDSPRPAGPPTVWPELKLDPQPVPDPSPAETRTAPLADADARHAPVRPEPAARAPEPAMMSIDLEPLEPEPVAPAKAATAQVTAPSLAPTKTQATPAPVPRAEPESDRQAVRGVFAAKKGPAASSRTPFYAAVGALALAGAGGAWYVWNETQVAAPPVQASGPIGSPRNAVTPPPGAPAAAVPQTTVATPPPPPAATATAPTATPPAVAAAPRPATAGEAPRNAPAIVAEAPPPARQTVPTSQQVPATPSVPERPAARAEAPAPRLPGTATARGGNPVDAPSGMRISRDKPASSIDPGVAAGYAALSEGNVEAAREAYARALAADPASRDALFGMAVVAQRSGQNDVAEGLYRRVLELYPREPYATAQLSALRKGTDPAATESRVKAMIADTREAGAGAPLQFALGNQLASQGRWAEAQQAYFDALAGDPDNPDYCYNLAVALDQIHQPKLARDHYARALDMAAKRRPAFDLNRAKARLDQLTAALR
jgi:tetratricopeptide (TPR) repeat protein